ncbi:immunity protein 26 of polymorphic toxin system [Anaerospora hongkongensis]|uniref:Immunity protein 26 of polymorphic toxin system n=1 Tax=Anaerospora hongkongensis TaxID=244830 RepID=A0A4R1Q5H4_9FIRM|nr:Imm26 family immunity protein [Anaerospora hongkongensis]TCL39806.1 immunity protein 26 of polymorphic toxin system [Anaerospora hongkongensis]
MKDIKFKAGDLVAVPLSDTEFVTARVMMYPKEQIQEAEVKKVEAEFEQAPSEKLRPGTRFVRDLIGVLLEVYSKVFAEPTPERSEILFPGINVSSYNIINGNYPIIGHVPVNPAEVEFPESLFQIWSGGARWYFCRGEVCLRLPDDDLKNIDAWRGIPKINRMLGGIGQEYVRYYQGDHQTGWSLAKCDLRFHERQREVYETLGLKENEPYYEFALRCGFDLARFYPHKPRTDGRSGFKKQEFAGC